MCIHCLGHFRFFLKTLNRWRTEEEQLEGGQMRRMKGEYAYIVYIYENVIMKPIISIINTLIKRLVKD
jgi:hypothetical protein